MKIDFEILMKGEDAWVGVVLGPLHKDSKFKPMKPLVWVLEPNTKGYATMNFTMSNYYNVINSMIMSTTSNWWCNLLVVIVSTSGIIWCTYRKKIYLARAKIEAKIEATIITIDGLEKTR